MLKNAFAYVTRKSLKSLIILLIILSMSALSLISLSIKDATNKASEETFGNITNSFTMEINRRVNQGTARGGGNVRGQDIKKIVDSGHVDNFVKRINSVANLDDNLDIVEAPGASRNESAERAKNFKRAVMLTGVNSSQKETKFVSGAYKLVEGEHLTSEDKNKILMHKDLAAKNNLKVGDKIKLKSNVYDADNEKKANNETEVKIVGTFSGKNKGRVTAPQELYENTILTDLKTTRLMYGFSEEDGTYLDATFLVSGEYDIDKVMEQAKKLGINWKAYTLVKSSQNYPTLQKSINLVYGLTNKLFIGSLIFSAIILVLILFLWTNSRRKEIGIRLALGMTKKTIITQMLCEVGMVSIASFGAAFLAGGPVSEWVGKLILGQVNSSLGTQLANEAKSANLGGGAAVDGFNKTLTELSVTVSNMDKGIVIGLGLVVIVIAVLLASALILQKSPKGLLQDTE